MLKPMWMMPKCRKMEGEQPPVLVGSEGGGGEVSAPGEDLLGGGLG